MISVEEAEKIILHHIGSFGYTTVSLQQASSRILAEDIYTDRDLPPYNRVTMDGIAIDYSSWKQGRRSFEIEGIQAAGMPQKTIKNNDACLEVMTGAILPIGIDTVIRYEDLTLSDAIATINIDQLKQGQNVHSQGHDRLIGDLLLSKGHLIGPAEINVCATVGKTVIQVKSLPKVMIISTGDELVPISDQPKAHQVRRSNVFGLQSNLLALGIDADTNHINDDKSELNRLIADYLKTYDLIVLSGGVSKGKFDYIPEVLEELKVDKLFHKVRQRPGKPFWFGRHISGTTVFALPGNPVSSFLCTQRYLMPWLKQSLGIPSTTLSAALTQDISFSKDLDYFAQVKLSWIDGTLSASPVEGNGSGDLANLTQADAFIQLPRGKDLFLKGEKYKVFPYRSLNDII